MGCNHSKVNGRSDKCYLCEWIANGKVGPMPKSAVFQLNAEVSQPKKVALRTCQRCGDRVDARDIVSRNQIHVCVGCARDLDEAEEEDL